MTNRRLVPMPTESRRSEVPPRACRGHRAVRPESLALLRLSDRGRDHLVCRERTADRHRIAGRILLESELAVSSLPANDVLDCSNRRRPDETAGEGARQTRARSLRTSGREPGARVAVSAAAHRISAARAVPRRWLSSTSRYHRHCQAPSAPRPAALPGCPSDVADKLLGVTGWSWISVSSSLLGATMS
jgi:hypothetical protein